MRRAVVFLTRYLRERIFDDLKSLGFSLGFSRAIEACVGEVWVADALKDGEKWVVRAPTPGQAFAELRGQCERALQVEWPRKKSLDRFSGKVEKEGNPCSPDMESCRVGWQRVRLTVVALA